MWIGGGLQGQECGKESSWMTMLDKQIKVRSCVVDRSHHVRPAVIAFMFFLGKLGGDTDEDGGTNEGSNTNERGGTDDREGVTDDKEGITGGRGRWHGQTRTAAWMDKDSGTNEDGGMNEGSNTNERGSTDEEEHKWQDFGCVT